MLPILILGFVSAAFATPQVKLGHTTVVGANYVASNAEFFGGIPFAQPPLGQLRLRRPKLMTSIQATTLNATTYGRGCLQAGSPAQTVSEDCLTLNIIRPAGVDSHAKLPVMFWLYGGGFTSGNAASYNGTAIVARSVARGTPIIFASANYRLGALGFPQGHETKYRHAENLGLSDQVVALQWIQANIGVFGGDKDKVTIIGESAGAISASVHLLGAGINRLARAAILESTAALPTFYPERNQLTWETFVAAVPECSKLANSQHTFDCIRNASSDSLYQAITATAGNSSYGILLDGPGGFLPDLPSQLTPKHKLPVLIGTNLDEATILSPQGINSTDQIRDFFISYVSPSERGPTKLAASVEHLLKIYPDIPALGSPYNTGNNTFGLSSQFKRFAAIYGDFLFHSLRRAFTEKLSKAGLDVYIYYFTDPDAFIPPSFTPVPPAPGSLGVTHGSEIFYLFDFLPQPSLTASQLLVNIQDYWISFTACLDPNDHHGSKRPTWKKYTPNNQVLMQLNGHDTKLIPDTYREQNIAFLKSDPLIFNR